MEMLPRIVNGASQCGSAKQEARWSPLPAPAPRRGLAATTPLSARPRLVTDGFLGSRSHVLRRPGAEIDGVGRAQGDRNQF